MRKIVGRISRNIAALYSVRRLAFLLAGAAAFFWLFNFSSAPISSPSFARTTDQAGFLDLMPFYTAEQAFASLEHYGVQGRELYLHFLAADFIFILFYSLSFALLFTCAVRARFGVSSAWMVLNLLPVAAGLFDCLENACILAMLSMYPKTNWLIGTASGFATAAKWVATCLSLLCLAYLGASLLIRKLSRSRVG